MSGPSTLRCLLVTLALDAGGMDEMVAFLARRLPEHGVRTAVLHVRPDPSATGAPQGRLGRMLRSSGVDVHETDEGNAPAFLQRWRPDVISAHGWLPYSVVAAAQRSGVPYVDTLHGTHQLMGPDWHAKAVRNGSLAAVVTVGERVRLQYLALPVNRGFPPDRIVAIPNGVDDERRFGGDRTAIRDRLGVTDEFLLVSLARYCMAKNSYGLVAAFGDLARRRPEAHLVVAGRPDEIRYYRRVARLRDSLPRPDLIHLRDHMPAPAELLAAADGFVLDSFAEGGPLVSMEALCTGVPVVLSDVGTASEQIGGDRRRGYLVSSPLGDASPIDWESIGAAGYRPQANRGELVAAIDKLDADRERYLADRERLAAESLARFSANACLARHAAVLRAVAAGSDLPGAEALAALPGGRAFAPFKPTAGHVS